MDMDIGKWEEDEPVLENGVHTGYSEKIEYSEFSHGLTPLKTRRSSRCLTSYGLLRRVLIWPKRTGSRRYHGGWAHI
jgi:hypothetical protein